jgi:hypothetical protein
MKSLELLYGAASVLVGDQMAEFSQQVSGDLDEVLVHRRGTEMLVHCSGSISLQILVVGDELNDPVPYFRSNMISRRLDELEDGVDVPFILVKK